MFVELLEIAEATMVITTLSVGLISTSVSIVKGTHPPDFGVFVSSVQPPYESDDKRIYFDCNASSSILCIAIFLF